MKTLCIVILHLFFICASSLNAQSIEEIDNKIDSVNTSIEFHKKEIIKLNEQLTLLNNKRTEIQATKSTGIVLYCTLGTLMRDQPNGNKLAQITRGEKVILVNSNPGQEYYEISFAGKSGFVLKASFVTEIEYAKIAAENEQRKIEKEEAAKARFNDLVLKYGEANAYKIKTNSFVIGWNSNMVEESIGKPDKINRTVTQSTIHEQWIYNDKDLYLYFDNDILISFQDSK